jgi:YVTN family beta-propeller protein
MKKMNKLFLITLLGISLTSCEPDDKVIDQYQPKGNYDSGVLVLNEGGFQVGNSSVSFISFDLNTTQNNIFSGANNGLLLGDTAQSICFKDDLAYIVLNGSNKIEVVNRYTMIKVATITTGLNNPRYMVIANGKGYVTNWGNAYAVPVEPAFVAVINLSTNVVSSTIPVISDPEKIIQNQGKLYVAHYGFGYNNKVSIIDSSTNAVVGTPITVGEGPKDLQIENNNLWVSCEGLKGDPTSEANDLPARIFKINLTNLSSTNFKYTSNLKHISQFQIYNSNAYYTIGSAIYKFPLNQTATTLPSASVFTSTIANLYGFSVANNRIYVSGYDSFNSNGSVLIYSLGELTDSPAIGTLLRTTSVGVGPNGFYFNQ